MIKFEPMDLPAPELLTPGAVFGLAHLEDLSDFEDAIAPLVDENYDHRLWLGRQVVTDLVRPDNFYGRLEDITVTIMTDPYEQLASAPKQGWMFDINFKIPIDGLKPTIAQSYQGFVFRAIARSSRGVQDTTRSKLWLAPPTRSSITHGEALRRFVTKPRTAGTILEQSYDEAVRNGVDTRLMRVPVRPRGRILEPEPSMNTEPYA